MLPLPAYRRSGRTADSSAALSDDPVMGHAACRGVLLRLHQPMLGFGHGGGDALSLALPAIDGLERLFPPRSARQLDPEHTSRSIPLRLRMSAPRDLAAEGAREGSRFRRGFKFEAKGGLVELKDPWRDPVSIEPMSHLGHRPDQSAAAPPANPHNVHRDSPGRCLP